MGAAPVEEEGGGSREAAAPAKSRQRGQCYAGEQEAEPDGGPRPLQESLASHPSVVLPSQPLPALVPCGSAEGSLRLPLLPARRELRRLLPLPRLLSGESPGSRHDLGTSVRQGEVVEGVSAGGGRREPGGDAEGSESSPEVYLEHAADITWQSQRAIPAARGLVLERRGSRWNRSKTQQGFFSGAWAQL